MTNKQKKEVLVYLDTMIFVYCLKPKSRPKFAKISKKFLNEIEKGKYKAIVSTLGIMEVIKVLRNHLVKIEQVYKKEDWKVEEKKAIKFILKLKNCHILEDTPETIISEQLTGLYYADIIDDALHILKKYQGKVGKNRKDEFIHDGLGPVDCLHLILAKQCGCDKIATFDRDFEDSGEEIEPYILQDDFTLGG